MTAKNKYYKSYRYVTLARDSTDDPQVERLRRDLGEQLRIFLKEQYQTLKRAAKFLDCSPAYLSQICRGKRTPNLKLRQNLTRAGFPEHKLFNYFYSKDLDDSENISAREIILELKRIIERQDSLLKFYQRAIVELRQDFDELRKINKSANKQKLTNP